MITAAPTAVARTFSFWVCRSRCQFQQLDLGYPLAFAQQHFAGLDLVEDGIDLGRGGPLALLGFTAVQRNVGLDEPLDEIDDRSRTI